MEAEHLQTVNPGERDEGLAGGPLHHVELLRVIDRTVHESPRKRRREIEFHVYNPTATNLGLTLLPLEEFAEDLRVLDEDGTRLSLLPNRTLEDMVATLPEQAREQIYSSFEHVNYQVGVLFPPERPLQSESTRVVTFKMEAPDIVQMADARSPSLWRGWKDGGWMTTFFSIPTFEEETSRYPGEEHDHFLVVRGLEDYAIKSETKLSGPDPSREIHPPDDGGRVTSTRLPEADNGEYAWGRSYQLRPIRSTTAGILAAFWTVAAAIALPSTGFLAWALKSVATYGIASSGVRFVSNLGQATSAGIVGTVVGLLVSLKAGWTERYKTLLLSVLIVHLLLWVGWVSV